MRIAKLLVVLCCFSCADPRPVVEGQVVNAATQAPIPNARVAVSGGDEVVTDRDGRFELFAAGPATVTADGYLTLRTPRPGGVIALWPESLPPELSDAAHAKLHSDQAPAEGDVRRDFAEAMRRFEEGDDAPIGLEPPSELSDPRFGQLRQALTATPTTIRVWRRRLDDSTASCAGRVDVIPFEEYIKGVLPHEWIASWDKKSLRMGAVAIRSYAWAIIASGGRYECADVDDTSNTQVYRDERLDKTDAIVDETRGQVITRNGRLVAGQYSAENGDPTAFGVSEPHCAGKEIAGHRRGTCQRGSQRWATIEGRDHAWMTAHYYPGATLYVPSVSALMMTRIEGEAGELPMEEAPPDETPIDEPHDVAAQEQPAPEIAIESGGCSATGAIPMLAIWALLSATPLAARRRRR